MTIEPANIRFATLGNTERQSFMGTSLDSLIAYIEEYTFILDLQSEMLTAVLISDNEPPSEHTRPCTTISGAQEMVATVLNSTPSETLPDLGWTRVL